MSAHANEDRIAVVGLACRFPGAPDASAFWRNLRAGIESLVRFDDDELLAAGVAPRWFRQPGYVAAGMVLDGIDEFDAGFFGLSDGEAAALDPQQRLMLECAWEALEDAGHPPPGGALRVGVYAGARLSDYLCSRQPPVDLFGHGPEEPAIHFQRLLANDKDYVATRLAWTLDLRGPAVSVQTACSTSLVAVHLACQSLLDGECDLALAGGVSVRLPQRAGYLCSPGMIFSPDGHTRAFDARAAGTVFGSGAGMVALRRLPDALADGDRILAVIRGSAVNNDGREERASFTAPSPRGQAVVFEAALAAAELHAGDLSYLEAHGTATPLGDAIEVAALASVLRREPRRSEGCVLGSVKTNLGHLVQAAGVAGLIKTVLMLHHGELVPSLWFERPNPEVDWRSSALTVGTILRRWPLDGGPRRAGVGSYGFGGTNAYVVLEEHRTGAGEVAEGPRLFVLSASTPRALGELAEHTMAAMAGPTGPPLADVCFTTQVGRRDFARRQAVVAATTDEVCEWLAKARDAAPRLPPARPPRLGFAFSGQGALAPGAGRELASSHEGFRSSLERSDAALGGELGRPLREILFGPEAAEALTEDRLAQPALVALQIALVELWAAWGIAPAAVLGHGLGELTAAWAAGALDRDAVLRLAAGRGRAMQERCFGGAMLAVAAAAEAVEELVAACPAELALAAVNGQQQVVLAGTTEACERARQELAGRRVAARLLPVSRAYHSPLIVPALEEIERLAASLPATAPRLRWVSTVSGALLPAERAVASSHWRRQARAPVHFAAALATLAGEDIDAVVEIGPDAVLCALAAGTHTLPWSPSLRHGVDEHEQMLRSLAELWERGAEVDWAGYVASTGERRQRVTLPTYPFQRRRHWLPASRPATGAAHDSAESGLHEPVAHPLLGRRLRMPPPAVAFEARLSAASEPFLRDHRIYDQLPMLGSAHLEIAVAAAAAVAGTGDALQVEQLAIGRALGLLEDHEHLLHTALEPDGAEGHRLRLASSADGGALWQEHSTAQLRPCGRPRPTPLDLRGVAERCQQSMDPATVVAATERRGAALGPSLHMVRELRLGTSELLAVAELPEPVRPGAGRFLAHPVLLDACMQLAHLVHGRTEADGDLFLPTAVDRLTWLGRLPERVWCHLRAAGRGGAETYAVDFEIADESGEVLVEARGVVFKRARREALAATATAPVHELIRESSWEQAPPLPERSSLPGAGRWLLYGGGELARRLAAVLRAGGARVALVEADIGQRALRLERALAEVSAQAGRGESLAALVHLHGAELALDVGEEALLDPQRAATLAASALAAAQLLAEHQERHPADRGAELCLVTRGAQRTGAGAGPMHAAAATLWGLGRVIQREEPELRCRLLDLDPAAGEGEEVALVAELTAARGEPLLAHRAGRRWVPRLRRLAATRLVATHPLPLRPLRPLAVAAGRERTLESLRLEPCERRPPGPGEVEIRVLATGLNFRDALNATGRLRGPLGWECSGLVVATGPGVTQLALGDAVVALVPDCLRELVTVDARRVAPKPTNVGFAAGATLPAAYLTASWALDHLASVQPGQRVLVHTAAGGVGQAALQVALRAGAEVYATSSHAKWPYLRSLGVAEPMDSRRPGFSRRLLAATGGAGVDAVVNTLAGSFVEESLAVLREGGHFVELGHPDMDVWTTERLTAARPDIHAHHFRLSEDVAREQPELLAALLASLVRDIENGRLRPLPRHLHPAADLGAALSSLLAARHVGKRVVVWPPQPGDVRRPTLRPDATYVVTGGTGALGLQVARRLATLGARHLVLVSRRATAVPPPVIEGAEVRVVNADVSDPAAVNRLVEEIRATSPPLRGVVHAAGVLDDGMLRRQDDERLARVFAPKVAGAFHLHQATRDLPLDFFVLFSSLATLSGNPGQATYAAANAYLDALAHLRRERGLPAISIAWGPWGGAGMAAGLELAQRQRREAAGVAELEPQRALDALSELLASDSVQVAVAAADWSRLGQSARDGLGSGQETAEGRGSLVPASEAPRDAEEVLRVVREEVAAQAGLAAAGLDVQATLRALGLDSLAVLSLRGRLLARLGGGTAAPVGLFLEDPTVVRLAAAVAGANDASGQPDAAAPGLHQVTPPANPATGSVCDAARTPAGSGPVAPEEVRRGLTSITAGWRRPDDPHRGLLVRGGPAGGGTPIFWCLQGEAELRALAGALPGRTLWGMRSSHLLMDTTIDNIRTLAGLYASEVAALAGHEPVVLGGNCQGSVIAFLIAQRLWAQGIHVNRLCLLENRVPTVVQDVYPGRVAMFFGADSDHVHHPFKQFLDPHRGWQRLYPHGYTVDFLPAAHGHFFAHPALEPFARRLLSVLEEADAGAAGMAAVASLRAGVIELSVELGSDAGASGTYREVTLRLDNRGDRDWLCPLAAGVVVGAHWIDEVGRVLAWADGARTLELTVPAHGSVSLALPLAPPAEDVAARLRVGLAEDGVDWLVSAEADWPGDAVEAARPEPPSSGSAASRR